MDGKEEKVPGGGEGYIVDGILREGKIIKRPPPTLETLARRIFKPDFKTLEQDGVELVGEIPIWAKGGLLESAEKLEPAERASLLRGAAHARAYDILVKGTGKGSRNSILADREEIDYAYFEQLLRDRARVDKKLRFNPSEQIPLGLQLKLVEDTRPQERGPYIHQLALTAAGRNLGLDSRLIHEPLLEARAEVEREYLEGALASMNLIRTGTRRRA